MRTSTLGLASFLVVFSFAACKKIDLLEQDKLIQEVNFIDYEKSGKCFELVFPVNYAMPDGSTIMGDTEKEIDQAIKAWYETHPSSKEKPILQYPVEITFADQNTGVPVGDKEEMQTMKEKCDQELEEKDECFELVFPLSYTMPDGSTITGNDKEEIELAFKAWYEAHPDSKEEASLQYPVEVIFEGKDQSLSVNNDEEMEQAKKDCGKDWEEKDDCFELVFPVSYAMPDGSTIMGNDDTEIDQAIKTWYEAHPENKEKPVLQYPVEVTLEGQNMNLTVEDNDEMTRLKEDCN